MEEKLVLGGVSPVMSSLNALGIGSVYVVLYEWDTWRTVGQDKISLSIIKDENKR